MENVVTRLNLLNSVKVGPKLWSLNYDLIFRDSYGVEYAVPRDFYTDGASNIRILWGLCPPMAGETGEPSVLHDWLYSLDCKLDITRKQADDIYLSAMKANGVGLVRRQAIYAGVRAGGASSWKKCYSRDKFFNLMHTTYMN